MKLFLAAALVAALSFANTETIVPTPTQAQKDAWKDEAVGELSTTEKTDYDRALLKIERNFSVSSAEQAAVDKVAANAAAKEQAWITANTQTITTKTPTAEEKAEIEMTAKATLTKD